MERAQAVNSIMGALFNMCCLQCFYSFNSSHNSQPSQGLEAVKEVMLCQGQ
jgi:hypothetical protein